MPNKFFVILFSLSLSNINPIFGQYHKLGIVNLDSVTNEICSQLNIGSIFSKHKTLLEKIGQIWVQKLLNKADRDIKDIRCSSPNYLLKKQKELVNIEQNLIAFQIFINDSLVIYKKLCTRNIKSTLICDYIKIGKREKYNLIADKSQILYRDSSFKADKYLIKRKLNYNSRIKKILTDLELKIERKKTEINGKINEMKIFK